MKFETTFEDLGKIFSTVAKAEKKVAALKAAKKAYSEASEEYCKNDYDAFYAMRQCEAYDVAEKALKAVKRVFSELVDVLGLDRSAKYGEEGYLIELSTRFWEPGSFLSAAKHEAIRISKFVNN